MYDMAHGSSSVLLQAVNSFVRVFHKIAGMTVREALWLTRFRCRKLRSFPVQRDCTSATSLAVYWINLESATERRELMVTELEQMNLINHKRVEGVYREFGAHGCALSHLTVLEMAKDQEPGFLVCEDDVQFLVPSEYLEAVVEEFFSNPALDVLCLAFNSFGLTREASENLLISRQVQTTSCFVVKRRSVDKLRASFTEASVQLGRGADEAHWAIDQHWKKIQNGSLFFAVPKRRVARQRSGYSDIRRTWVDYGV